jgi:methyl-accepting chemotaxis protein
MTEKKNAEEPRSQAPVPPEPAAKAPEPRHSRIRMFVSAVRPRLIGVGLAPKLLGTNATVIVLVASITLIQGSAQLESSMTRAFESKGEAIALSLAAASEQSVNTDASLIQGSIDSNKVIEGVRYIFVTDMRGNVSAHTFTPTFPPGLMGVNTIGLGEVLGEVDGEARRVKVERIQYETPTGAESAIDVAAPIAGGALGTVHVGMDQALIQESVDSLREQVMLSGGVVALVGIAIGLLVTLMWVVRPIGELTRVTADIVRKGDLTQEIRISSRDEIGQLANTFSLMVEKLRAIPRNLGESADLLNGALGRLSSTTTEQAETINQQAAALQEAQATVQEIRQTSLVASQKAQAVLEVAERADEISKSGETAIEESLAALTEIRKQVEAMAETISDLTERTRQIGLITETVKDLADQSNILALNASIEAVRSGEHGKGFGVVAREIRSLADQSIQATQRVREILEDISTAIRGTVAITEKGAQRMEGGLAQVNVSGERLRELSGIVRDNSAAVRQIAAAVSQQNAGITQIVAAVSDLNSMMDETVKRIETTTSSVGTLREATDRISEVIDSFRV